MKSLSLPGRDRGPAMSSSAKLSQEGASSISRRIRIESGFRGSDPTASNLLLRRVHVPRFGNSIVSHKSKPKWKNIKLFLVKL
jgi:hypothetical protein